MAEYTFYQRLAARLILDIEARLEGTVQIEYADQDLIADQGHYELRSGGYVASNMAGKSMDVRHPYRFASGRRRATHAAAKRNSYTGGLALKRAQTNSAPRTR